MKIGCLPVLISFRAMSSPIHARGPEPKGTKVNGAGFLPSSTFHSSLSGSKRSARELLPITSSSCRIIKGWLKLTWIFPATLRQVCKDKRRNRKLGTLRKLPDFTFNCHLHILSKLAAQGRCRWPQPKCLVKYL